MEGGARTGVLTRPRPGTREEAAVETRQPPRRWIRSIGLWVAVLLICVFCLFPFYWLINVSLKSGADLSQADLVPPSPTHDNYN